MTRRASGAAFGDVRGDRRVGETDGEREHGAGTSGKHPAPSRKRDGPSVASGMAIRGPERGRAPDTQKHRHPPLTGDERCWPVVPPLFAATLRPATSLHGNTLGAGMWWSTADVRYIGSVTGASFPEIREPVAAYCTELIRGSGRCSRVLFAGIPDPASQQSRFSASTLPGSRPCRRSDSSVVFMQGTESFPACQGLWRGVRAL